MDPIYNDSKIDWWICRSTPNRLKMTLLIVVLCRIRLFATLISKIKWFGPGLPLKLSIFFKKISGRNRHHLSLAMVLERYSSWHSFMVSPFGTRSIHISDWFQLSVGSFLLLLLLLPFQQFQTHILDWAWEVFLLDSGLVHLLHGWFFLYFSNACPTGNLNDTEQDPQDVDLDLWCPDVLVFVPGLPGWWATFWDTKEESHNGSKDFGNPGRRGRRLPAEAWYRGISSCHERLKGLGFL